MMLNELKKVIIDQEIAFSHFFATTELIDREVDLKLLFGYLKNPNVLVITGVRRCGKSVLAHQILRKMCVSHAFVNFDDERLANFSSSDFDSLLQAIYQLKGKDVEYFLFDEIQNVPGWELFITRLRLNGKIIITGSNAKMLSRELSTHLTGRHINFTLFPFSFVEYLKLKKINTKEMSTQNESMIISEFDNYLQNGGFPEVEKIGVSILPEIYGDIINRDIIIRHKIRKARTFKEMTSYLFSNFGQIMSFSKLKSVFQIKHLTTIANYLDYLEETYLIFVLNKFSFKLKEQVTSMKKIYPIDSGMANHMSRASTENRGGLLETAVFLELMRRSLNFNNTHEIFYWRDYADHEIDFVQKVKNEVKELIQVTESLKEINTANREFRSLISASKELRCKNLFVLTRNETGEKIIDDLRISVMPVWKWMISFPKANI